MNKDNQQAITEAKANLQAAQLLDAINAVNLGMLDFAKISKYDLEHAFSALSAVKKLGEAVTRFQQHSCNLSEIKLVSDIVDGIKMRSAYEMKIEQLEKRLKGASDYYLKMKEVQLKMQKFILELAPLPDKKDRTNLLKATKWSSLDEVLDVIVNELTPRCSNRDEMPW